jgi:hypothetical protein
MRQPPLKTILNPLRKPLGFWEEEEAGWPHYCANPNSRCASEVEIRRNHA